MCAFDAKRQAAKTDHSYGYASVGLASTPRTGETERLANHHSRSRSLEPLNYPGKAVRLAQAAPLLAAVGSSRAGLTRSKRRPWLSMRMPAGTA